MVGDRRCCNINFNTKVYFHKQKQYSVQLPENITIAKNSSSPLTVKRFGYGTMRLTGEGIYGEPANRLEALQILKQCIADGIQFLDTADYYGDDVTNRLIAEALYPYPNELVICTKVGGTRKPDKSWIPFNTPENLRTSIENNLRTLKLEQIQLVHFRVMPHAATPFTASMEAMFAMQQEGKILHVGVSNVNEQELQTAMAMGSIATVENMYGYAQRNTHVSHYGENRGGEEILSICEAKNILLIPYFSLLNSLPKNNEKINAIATKYNASAAQINLAWLLHRSPIILPIPGTSSLAHFNENNKAIAITLTQDDMDNLG